MPPQPPPTLGPKKRMLAKRPYTPKVKGCYECSQRRVSCDRGVPECQKCTLRGLTCSGLGVRHRFNKGVAARGAWAGRTVESMYRSHDASPDSPKAGSGNSKTTSRQRTVPTTGAWTRATLQEAPPPGDPEVPHESGSTAITASELYRSLEYKVIIPRPYPDVVPAMKRRLLLHYSEHIANEMLAIDGPHNGWRHVVIPIAYSDDLVMDAVLTISLFHLSPCLRHDGPAWDVVLEPNHMYARAIQGLRRRSELQGVDSHGHHCIIVAILLLLTAGMVTGFSDFPLLFGMLQSAIDAIGGVSELGNGDIAEFLTRQIRKMRVYAAPLLSEDSAIELFSSETEILHMFDCLHHCLLRSPEYNETVRLIPDLVLQACGIYLNHVQTDDPDFSSPAAIATRISDSIDRVQRFKETCEMFTPGTPGEKVLIWACFIAASDCLLEEHKAFFEGFLLRQYSRSGFKNLQMGLDALRRIWMRSPAERWSTLLPLTRVFIM